MFYYNRKAFENIHFHLITNIRNKQKYIENLIEDIQKTKDLLKFKNNLKPLT